MFQLALSVALLSGMLWRTSVHSADTQGELSCEEARIKCAYRKGCGMALRNYLVDCSSVLHDNTRCPEVCQHALIALTSTDEGHKLMTCECKNDTLCQDTKAKVEVCRPHVTRATRNESIVSCTLAHYICAADNECSTAMDYYNRYCKSMFHGRKCSNRCKNSINILRRQEKAAKLDTCVCDGNEDYNCVGIRNNMAKLCYHKEPNILPPDLETNELAPREARESGASFVTSVPVLSLIISWSLLVT